MTDRLNEVSRHQQNRLKRIFSRLGYYTRPAFIVIGAQKGGTKSLRRYLLEHPAIIERPGVSEIHFFDKERSYQKGADHYHHYFPYPFQMTHGKITFDNTPNYLSIPAVPERIHRYHPSVKLIAVLRDPVERAFSAWNMVTNKGREDATFEARIEHDIARFEALQAASALDQMDEELAMSPVVHGLYHLHLARYLRYFERDQLLILDSKHLREQPKDELKKVTAFLGIAPHEWQAPIETHVGSYRETISAETKARLSDFYRPYNQQLYSLLGHDFGWK